MTELLRQKGGKTSDRVTFLEGRQNKTDFFPQSGGKTNDRVASLETSQNKLLSCFLKREASQMTELLP